MVVVWRGMGIVIPILLAVFAGLLSLVFDDTRLGNLAYTGWILIATAVPTALVALASLGGEEGGGWTKHSLFFVPVALWVPLLAGLGIYCLVQHHPASEQAIGVWRFERCIDTCEPSLARALENMTITIDEEAITVGDERRAYEVATEKGAHLSLRYEDNGEEERMIMGDDSFIGYITSAEDADGVAVRFARAKK